MGACRLVDVGLLFPSYHPHLRRRDLLQRAWLLQGGIYSYLFFVKNDTLSFVYLSFLLQRLKSLFTPGIRPSFSDFHVHPNSCRKQEMQNKKEEEAVEAVDTKFKEGEGEDA